LPGRREEGYLREGHDRRLALVVLSGLPTGTKTERDLKKKLTGVDAKVHAAYRKDCEPDGQNVVLKL